MASAGAAVPSSRAARARRLHIGIIRSSSALGHDPVDVLRRVLDVAGLAVDAILGVDLEPRPPLFLDKFIDARRTISLLRTCINGQIHLGGYVGILERQVNGLVFLMIG